MEYQKEGSRQVKKKKKMLERSHEEGRPNEQRV